MSTVFTPGWVWTPSVRTVPLDIVASTQDSFAPKVANNSMNSFHLVKSAYGQPAYLQVRCSKVADIYENTGVTPSFQMPIKTGKKAELTFYGLGNATMTQGAVEKDYLVPLGASFSYWMPEVALESDENMNILLADIFKTILLGSLLQDSTSGDVVTTHLDFMQILKGVLNLPGVLPTEPAE